MSGKLRTVRYLSLDWIDAVDRAVAANEPIQELVPTHEIGVTQVVTDGPEGDITYHLQVGDGAIAFAAGPADPEHVRMEQSWETAVAVATGEPQRPGGVRVRADPAARRPATVARLAAGVRRPRLRVPAVREETVYE